MNILCLILIVLCSFSFSKLALAASELDARKQISGSVKAAFMQDDFSALEEMSRNYRVSRSRTTSGLWNLTLFYAGIGAGINEVVEANEREVAFRELGDKITRWARQYPDSPTPHIVFSMVHIEHAWEYRGRGYAYTVPPEAWVPFRKYIALAKQNLEAHKAIAAADPKWYEVMLIVARTEGWERGDFDRLLSEALEREPAFYQTYFQALEYLLPKWHGGVKEIEEFARDAVRRTTQTEGQGMYARIYWYASQAQFENNLFSESSVVWPSMKLGFDDVVARYPDAWNLNNYAKFACLARDKTKMKELLKRIDHDVVVEAWEPNYLFPLCSKWALEEVM